MRAFLYGTLAVLLLAVLVLLWWGRPNQSLPGIDASGRTSAAIPGHRDALKSRDAATRQQAATALWQIGPYAKEATPDLLEASKDGDAGVREAAFKALGRTGQGAPDVVPALVAGVRDPEAAV